MLLPRRTLKIVGSSCALTLGIFTALSHKSLSDTTFRDSPKIVLDEAWQIVDQTYVDPQFNHVDWRTVRQQLLSRSYSTREAAYAALKDALKQLDDPYTRFLDPEEFQALSRNDIDGELTGIGIQFDVDAQGVKVVKTLPQTPAVQAGIHSGDRILAIDGRSTKGMSEEMAASLMRGVANTKVTLLLGREQQPAFNVTLTRKHLELPVVTSALRQTGGERIGYIRLEEFSGHAAEQMKQAIGNLERQNVNRYVLDLRGNPGGLLDQETAIARMWLNQGVIVQIVNRNKQSERIAANHTARTSKPVTVLVDGGSASASEILTGALKDNRRALVVGTKTFGKALVQSVNPLSDGSAVNVTIAHYYTPAGLDINHRGIQPNLVVPLTKQQQQELSNHPDELGTERDPQYAAAIQRVNLSQIGPAKL